MLALGTVPWLLGRIDDFKFDIWLFWFRRRITIRTQKIIRVLSLPVTLQFFLYRLRKFEGKEKVTLGKDVCITRLKGGGTYIQYGGKSWYIQQLPTTLLHTKEVYETQDDDSIGIRTLIPNDDSGLMNILSAFRFFGRLVLRFECISSQRPTVFKEGMTFVFDKSTGMVKSTHRGNWYAGMAIDKSISYFRKKLLF